MTPDHLDQLRRQRDLIRKHLEWLETEITREEASASASASPSVVASRQTPPAPEETQTPPAETSPAPSDAHEAAADADEALPDLDPRDVHDEVRRGCFIYVAIAVVLGLALIGFIYWRY